MHNKADRGVVKTAPGRVVLSIFDCLHNAEKFVILASAPALIEAIATSIVIDGGQSGLFIGLAAADYRAGG
jgi:hypothetical protein